MAGTSTETEQIERKARCVHYGQTIAGIICKAEVDSDPSLEGFEARPKEDYDVYYSGCWHNKT